jgi:glycosyltransferase involved in cell wall biosynthesis
VGDGDDRPRLEALARETGVANSVIFLRGLSRADLVSCFARCDVFALPSAGEGFGYVFVEAMALGKPTIGGAHGGTPDIIQDGDTGYLVTHGDVARLTMVIGKLLQDDSLRVQMGRRAGQHVRANFVFGQFESRLSELLLAIPSLQPLRRLNELRCLILNIQILDVHLDGKRNMIELRCCSDVHLLLGPRHATDN